MGFRRILALALLIQSPNDFQDTRRNDWRRQDNESTTFWQRSGRHLDPEISIWMADQVFWLRLNALAEVCALWAKSNFNSVKLTNAPAWITPTILSDFVKLKLQFGSPYCVVSNLWRIQDSVMTFAQFLSFVAARKLAHNKNPTQQSGHRLYKTGLRDIYSLAMLFVMAKNESGSYNICSQYDETCHLMWSKIYHLICGLCEIFSPWLQVCLSGNWSRST